MSDFNILKNNKQFVQLHLPNTNVCTLVSKSASRKVVFTDFLVTNVSGNAATISFFLDANGTTSDNTTCIASAVAVSAHTYVEFDFPNGLPLNYQTAGQLTAQANIANVLTVTVNGIEF